MNRRTMLRLACLSAIIAGSLAFSCGGGGGSGGGGVVIPPGLDADFVAAGPAGPMSLSLEPGAASGTDFDIDVMVNGAFADFFGAGFRITLPPSVMLDSSSSAGSFILAGGAGTQFSVVQQGNEILIVATRLQGSGGTYVAGVDVGAGNSSKLLTLSLEATAATSGALTISAPRQIETCNDVSETCAAVADGSVGWLGGTLTVM